MSFEVVPSSGSFVKGERASIDSRRGKVRNSYKCFQLVRYFKRLGGCCSTRFDDFCRADLALDIAEMRDTDDVQRRRDIYINVSAGQQCQESFV